MASHESLREDYALQSRGAKWRSLVLFAKLDRFPVYRLTTFLRAVGFKFKRRQSCLIAFQNAYIEVSWIPFSIVS